MTFSNAAKSNASSVVNIFRSKGSKKEFRANKNLPRNAVSRPNESTSEQGTGDQIQVPQSVFPPVMVDAQSESNASSKTKDHASALSKDSGPHDRHDATGLKAPLFLRTGNSESSRPKGAHAMNLSSLDSGQDRKVSMLARRPLGSHLMPTPSFLQARVQGRFK